MVIMITGRPRWNAALTYAITGQRWEDLTESDGPDLDLLVVQIGRRYPGGIDTLRDAAAARRRAGEPWPYEVPAELAEGLGAAQWLAALAGLRKRLELGPQPARPVLSDRQPDADELRLLRDVPPHHGR
jgi:hypothetical protein